MRTPRLLYIVCHVLLCTRTVPYTDTDTLNDVLRLDLTADHPTRTLTLTQRYGVTSAWMLRHVKVLGCGRLGCCPWNTR